MLTIYLCHPKNEVIPFLLLLLFNFLRQPCLVMSIYYLFMLNWQSLCTIVPTMVLWEIKNLESLLKIINSKTNYCLQDLQDIIDNTQTHKCIAWGHNIYIVYSITWRSDHIKTIKTYQQFSLWTMITFYKLLHYKKIGDHTF